MVLVAIFLMGLVAVAGLVADGGMVFVQRRDLQSVADAAAAAGAMQLDESAYRASAGSEVVLDEAAAYEAAAGYLSGEGRVTFTVTTSATGVEVQVSRGASTAFLRVLGIDDVSINASATAEPRHGVVAAVP